MIYTLYIQIPKPVKIGKGTLDISSKTNNAVLMSESGSILATLHRVKLERAARDGVWLSGMESNGYDINGTEKFKYQEWYLAYDT